MNSMYKRIQESIEDLTDCPEWKNRKVERQCFCRQVKEEMLVLCREGAHTVCVLQDRL